MTTASRQRNFGYGRNTPAKLERVNGLFGWIVTMSSGHLRDADGCFRYVDMNAGPGRYETPDGLLAEGSPILALRALLSAGVRFRATLIERDPARCEQLERALSARGFLTDAVTIRCADNRDLAPSVAAEFNPRRDRGVVFFDPKGCPDWQAIAACAQQPGMRGVDLLINVPTSAEKLVRSAAGNGRLRQYDSWATKDVRRLDERLPDLAKVRWLITKPSADRLHWSLLLGTNWRGFPPWRGVVEPVDDAQGAEWFQSATYTIRELETAAAIGR